MDITIQSCHQVGVVVVKFVITFLTYLTFFILGNWNHIILESVKLLIHVLWPGRKMRASWSLGTDPPSVAWN